MRPSSLETRAKRYNARRARRDKEKNDVATATVVVFLLLLSLFFEVRRRATTTTTTTTAQARRTPRTRPAYEKTRRAILREREEFRGATTRDVSKVVCFERFFSLWRRVRVESVPRFLLLSLSLSLSLRKSHLNARARVRSTDAKTSSLVFSLAKQRKRRNAQTGSFKR